MKSTSHIHHVWPPSWKAPVKWKELGAKGKGTPPPPSGLSEVTRSVEDVVEDIDWLAFTDETIRQLDYIMNREGREIAWLAEKYSGMLRYLVVKDWDGIFELAQEIWPVYEEVRHEQER